MTLVFQIKGY